MACRLTLTLVDNFFFNPYRKGKLFLENLHTRGYVQASLLEGLTYLIAIQKINMCKKKIFKGILALVKSQIVSIKSQVKDYQISSLLNPESVLTRNVIKWLM